MEKRWLKTGLLFLYVSTLIVFCLHPNYPQQMLLQHSATFFAGVFLIYVTIKNNISNTAFFCLFLFMIFHIVGAKWIYSYTPYNEWIKSLSGFSIDEYFGFQRNHYDRFVHFMYGFLLIIPISEIYGRWYKVSEKITLHLAFMFVLATSLIYELFEWSLTLLLTSEQADGYNGQQGDFWDAQKDMALATLGAIIMIVIQKIKRVKN